MAQHSLSRRPLNHSGTPNLNRRNNMASMATKLMAAATTPVRSMSLDEHHATILNFPLTVPSLRMKISQKEMRHV